MPAPEPRPPDTPELPGTNLFPDEVMEALTDEERKFALYTGERCPRQKREAIIELLADGRAIDHVRRLVNVHRQTVLNVANQFAAEIADYERRMAAKLRRCKWGLADRIEREVDSIPRQALGLTLKIVSDIEATDSGRAIARVDHVHRIDLFSDFPAFVRELEARPVIDQKNGAGTADQAPEVQTIHSWPGKKLLVDSPAADPGEQQPAGPGTDGQSDVSPLPTQESKPNLPTFTPGTGPKAAENDAPDRRGGDAAAPQPPKPTKDNGTPKFLGNEI